MVEARGETSPCLDRVKRKDHIATKSIERGSKKKTDKKGINFIPSIKLSILQPSSCQNSPRIQSCRERGREDSDKTLGDKSETPKGSPAKSPHHHHHSKKIEVGKYAEKTYDPSPEASLGVDLLLARCRGILVRSKYPIEKMVKRNEAIKEFIDTELNLIKNMELTEKFYHKPLEGLAPTSDEEKEEYLNDINVIFGNVPRFLQSSKMYIDWLLDTKERLNYFVCLSDTLSYLIQYIGPILSFTTDYNLIIDKWKKMKVRSNVIQLIKLNETNPELGNLTFEMLIIQPIQRIMRYPMLIGEIIKMTPKDHLDYKKLKKELKEYKFFCDIANQRTKMRDSLMKMTSELNRNDLFVNNRYVVYETTVNLKKTTKVYLCNDIVVVATKQSKAWNIETCELNENTMTQCEDKKVIIKVYQRRTPFVVNFEKSEDAKIFNKHCSEIFRTNWYRKDDDNWIDMIDYLMVH